MSDVFISYARSTAKQARAVVGALRGLGYSVWIDEQLPAHRNYSNVIEEELNRAKAVLVVWSAEAARSDWVMDEAEPAREQHKLVQVSLDETRLPMPFGRIHCADLMSWTGDAEASSWRKVVASIAELTGQALPAGLPAHFAAEAAQPIELLLAVLAFDNLSADPELAYFSDGVSEEIRETVSRTCNLKVIGRSSSFQFKGAEKAARNVAAELNVTHILDGAVRRSGNRVRISAELVECSRETSLWSRQFDRDLSSVFAVQDEIAAAVAEALSRAFSPSKPPGPIDPEAYALYLRARATALQGGVGLDTADWMTAADIGLLKQVLEKAPTFAPAWADLALAKAVQAQSGASQADFIVMTSEARAAAERALSLDESAGVAHAALSLLLPLCGQYRERELLLVRARASAPGSDFILFQSSVFATRAGRVREAFDFASRAYELNPLNPQCVFWLADLLFKIGRWTEAMDLWERGRLRWPKHSGMTLVAMFYAAIAGEWARVEALEAVARSDWSGTQDFATNGAAVAILRERPAGARRQLLELGRQSIASSGTVTLELLGFMSVLGLVDDAYELASAASFDHLLVAGDALAEASGSPHTIFDAQNKPLRDDPRFVLLCARLGLCQYWTETGLWPDCADDVPYDFKAEARRLAGAAA